MATERTTQQKDEAIAFATSLDCMSFTRSSASKLSRSVNLWQCWNTPYRKFVTHVTSRQSYSWPLIASVCWGFLSVSKITQIFNEISGRRRSFKNNSQLEFWVDLQPVMRKTFNYCAPCLTFRGYILVLYWIANQITLGCFLASK